MDRISEKHPVIIMADRGYENYNLFAHIEERLFDYVVRVRDSDNSCMVSGLNLPKTEEYDITKRVRLTQKNISIFQRSPGLIILKIAKVLIMR